MLQSLRGVDLSELSVEQLEGIADTVDAFVFKQQQPGEKFHPDYKRNKKLFKKLIRETVKFKRDIRKFFLAQFSRLDYLARFPYVLADESSDFEQAYLSNVQWDQEDQTLTAVLEVNLASFFEIGAKATELQLQTDLNIGPTHTEEAKFLRKYSVELAGEINQTTKKRVTQQIRTSIEVGETRQQLTARIDKVLNNPKRAEMIAQTESIRAYAEGRLAVGKRLKIPYKQLQSFQVDRGEICGRVSGEVVPLEQPFSNGLHSPPFHPRCFVGDVLVAAEGVSKAYKRWFEGEVVTISVAGKNVTATPNHPILTERGWVAAGALKAGDRVYQRVNWDTFIANPDNDYIVSRIEDVASALKMTSSVSTVTMPLSTPAFHGDGTINTEVEIVYTNSLLPDNLTESKQLLVKQRFGIAHLWRTLFVVNRSALQMFDRLLLATYSVMSSFSTLLTSFRSGTLSLYSHNVTSGTNEQPLFFEGSTNSVTINPSDSPSEINKRFASEIALVEINNVSVSKFSGHVYNLETKDSIYFANSILTHNCRCSIKLLYTNPNETNDQTDNRDMSVDKSIFDSAR